MLKISIHQDANGFWRACYYKTVPAKKFFLFGWLFKFKTSREAALFFNRKKFFGKKLFEIWAVY